MGFAAVRIRATAGEYFAFEDQTAEKHEFHDGQILAMSGNTYAHSLIAANTIRAVGNRLAGSDCHVLDGNIRVSVIPSSRYVYPDLSVVCGGPQFDPLDTKPRSLLNPKVVFEILSESTEAYDRGEKFGKYRLIPSLQEYVLLSQRQPEVETYLRSPDGTWSFASCIGGDAIATLRSLRLSLALSDVYFGVQFTSE